MKPAPFEYTAPQSLDEAVAIMAEHGDDAKLLAGGQSLIPVMNFRLAQPTLLVDLNNVASLSYIKRADDGGLRIGAMTRQSQIERSPIIAQLAPLVYETMPYIAHPQIRNRGTIGGSLVHADPAGELPVLAVALNASFHLQSSHGQRQVSAEAFYRGLFDTDLEPEEILTEISFPRFPTDAGYAFIERARRHGDYAQSGIAAVVTTDRDGRCQSARLVYLNGGDKPTLATAAANSLIGETATPERIAAAAHLAAHSEIEPTTDVHATADYKRHLAFVLGKRALAQAFERANREVRA